MIHVYNPQLALAIIRIMLGVYFILHASQKVFGLFGGPGLDGFAQWGLSIGIPSFLSYLAAFFELTGGLLLLFGIASEVGALLLIPVMLGAIYFVHMQNGFFSQNGGYEYALCLLILLIALLIAGPDSYTLWNPMKFTDITKLFYNPR